MIFCKRCMQIKRLSQRVNMPIVATTRPHAQAAPLQALLPVESCNIPLLDIEFFGDQAATRQLILDIDQYDYIVCISPNAAWQLGELLDQYWPMLPAKPIWICPGKGTQSQLANYGIRAQIPSAQSTSEGMLAMMPVCEHDKVLIVKGEGGRDWLQQQLLLLGANVKELNLYRRQLLALQPSQFAQLQHCQLVVISSLTVLETIELYLAQQNLKLINTALLVTSERLALAAHAANWRSIISISHADNQSIAKAISDWHKEFMNV